MRTWFFLDFVTLIPFDMIGVSSGTDSLKDTADVQLVSSCLVLGVSFSSSCSRWPLLMRQVCVLFAMPVAF